MSACTGAECACGCCQGTTGLTPVDLVNRPGLSALAYRVGTHPSFKETMLAGISAKGVLGKLTTRDDDDPTIALLDAWAVTLDVLTFYQERIANEGYLRTATERRSLLELARTIGYELRPGVAASTSLAFTLDGSPGSPREVVIPAGTRAQSLPTKSELPQSFETGDDLLARPEWNALQPQQVEAQTLAAQATQALLAGAATQLRPGDALLFVAKDPTKWDFHFLTAVEPRSEENLTLVTWKGGLKDLQDTAPAIFALRQRAAFFGANAPDWKAMTLAFKQEYVQLALGRAYDATQDKDWPKFSLDTGATKVDLDASYPRIAPESWAVLHTTGTDQLLKVQAAETASRSDFSLSARVTRLQVGSAVDPTVFKLRETAVFAQSEELAPALVPLDRLLAGNQIVLAGLVGGLVHGRDLIVQGKRMRVKLKGDAITLTAEDGSAQAQAKDGESLVVLSPPVTAAGSTTWHLRDRDGFSGFATVLPPSSSAVSAAADLTALSARPEVAAESLRTPIFRVGRRIDFRVSTLPRSTLTYLPAEADDPVVAEPAVLDEVTSDKERTTLKLAAPLVNQFDRTTVSVLANVAAATHGETRREVLGGGDAAKRFQRFQLRQKPLTYTAAPVPAGGESTLALRVGGVLWHEAPDFFQLGPRDRRYVLRRDDDGNTSVRFGDGVHGARLPSGVENVEAVYRTGIGAAGLVAESRISLLATRPLGVKSVTNPVAATGAADPEARDQARRNAPTTVLTLDRVVSLRDFEDFARAFSGIAKAQARELWDRGRRIVHLTVAGVGGSAVDASSATYKNLLLAMDRQRDPFQALVVESFDRILFRLRLRVKVDPDFIAATVLAAVDAALHAAFSFAARDFGQSVPLSAVMAVAQGVAGVVYVDVDAFYRDGLAATREDRIYALSARIDATGTVTRAQILILSPLPVAPEAIP